MGKSVLVMDTPDNCASCQMGNYDMNKGGVYCQLNKKENILWEDSQKEKPDWCPLLDMPEKQTVHCTDTRHHRWSKNGWNSCIDRILNRMKANEH